MTGTRESLFGIGAQDDHEIFVPSRPEDDWMADLREAGSLYAEARREASAMRRRAFDDLPLVWVRPATHHIDTGRPEDISFLFEREGGIPAW